MSNEYSPQGTDCHGTDNNRPLKDTRIEASEIEEDNAGIGINPADPDVINAFPLTAAPIVMPPLVSVKLSVHAVKSSSGNMIAQGAIPTVAAEMQTPLDGGAP